MYQIHIIGLMIFILFKKHNLTVNYNHTTPISLSINGFMDKKANVHQRECVGEEEGLGEGGGRCGAGDGAVLDGVGAWLK